MDYHHVSSVSRHLGAMLNYVKLLHSILRHIQMLVSINFRLPLGIIHFNFGFSLNKQKSKHFLVAPLMETPSHGESKTKIDPPICLMTEPDRSHPAGQKLNLHTEKYSAACSLLHIRSDVVK